MRSSLGVVSMVGIALSVFVVPVAWAQTGPGWSVNPALAAAAAQALMQPKSPTENPGAPKQWGNSEGTGAGMPVPGTGQAPRFFRAAPDIEHPRAGELIQDKEGATPR